jgi:hypothetical protein
VRQIEQEILGLLLLWMLRDAIIFCGSSRFETMVIRLEADRTGGSWSCSTHVAPSHESSARTMAYADDALSGCGRCSSSLSISRARSLDFTNVSTCPDTSGKLEFISPNCSGCTNQTSTGSSGSPGAVSASLSFGCLVARSSNMAFRAAVRSPPATVLFRRRRNRE